MLRDERYSRYTQLSDFITGIPGEKRGLKVLFKEPMCFTFCATDFYCNESRQNFSTSLKFAEFELETRYTPCVVAAPAQYRLTSFEFAAYCEVEDAN